MGAALRSRIKNWGLEKKVLCVYSNEVRENRGEKSFLKERTGLFPSDKKHELTVQCRTSCTFGMTLASLVVKEIDARRNSLLITLIFNLRANERFSRFP